MISVAHYYQTELAYYRELLRDLAQRYPEIAAMVLEGADAAVERTVQGAALITARLRHRVEDDFPELVAPLFQQLWPQHMRPNPAVTWIDLRVKPDALRTPWMLSPGSVVATQRIPQAEGREIVHPFQLASAVELLPLVLLDATLDRSRPADVQLRLRLRVTGSTPAERAGLRSLRLYVIGEDAARFDLWLALVRDLRSITVHDQAGQIRLTLPPTASHSVGFEPGEAIFPGSPIPLEGLRLLSEYFLLSDKFLGVELEQLDQLPPEVLRDDFELCFHLGERHDFPWNVDVDSFSLFCAPAINLLSEETMELRVEPGVSSYALDAPGKGDLFEVTRVAGYQRERGAWVVYENYYDAVLQPRQANGPYYQILRRGDGVLGTNSSLLLTDAKGDPVVPPGIERLSVTMSRSGDGKALQLDPGTVTSRGSGVPDFVDPINRSQVRTAEPLAIGRDHHWELMALYSMRTADLLTANGLNRLIERARGARQGPWALPVVRRVDSTLGTYLVGQRAWPTRQVAIEVGQEAFAFEGQAYLFGLLLSRALRRSGGAETLYRVTLRVQPGDVEYHYGPS